MGPPAITPDSSLLFVVLAIIVAVAAGVCVTLNVPDCIYVGPLVLAAAAALALTPIAIHFSFRLGVLDIPDERKNHERPIPLLGGLAVLASFAVAVLVGLAALPASVPSLDLRIQVMATLVVGALIALMGAADDKWGLSTGVRLIGQVVAACLVMRYGVTMTFLPPTPAGRVGETILTVLWVVGMTNAVNFLDGIDGLASSVSAVAALSFGAIAAMTGQTLVAVVSFCLAGAALGFLRFNFRLASVYLGDSGSTFLGFSLACIGIIGDWGARDRFEDILVPVLVLGIPIYDMIYITIYRVRAGLVRSLSEWAAYVGRDHLHHRLQHLGMRPSRVCLFISLGGVALGLLAAILKTKGEFDRYNKFFAITIAVIVFIGATILMGLGKARRGNDNSRQ